MNLQDVDLNLLVVFNELRKHGRVSAVAESLGISQPGVSNALGRLRKLLGDELFLRTSRGMVPTPYAEALARPIADALERPAQHAERARRLSIPRTASAHSWWG